MSTSSLKRRAEDTDDRGVFKKSRTNAYADDPFPDSPSVPQPTPNLGSHRKTAPSVAQRSFGPLLRTDNSTILDGRKLYFAQSRDLPIHLLATCATIPDTPPRNQQYRPDRAPPPTTQPTATKHRYPAGGLQIAAAHQSKSSATNHGTTSQATTRRDNPAHTPLPRVGPCDKPHSSTTSS